MTTRLGASVDLEALVRQARSAGQAVHVVDAGLDKQASLSAFATSLSLPPWFGHNLDALMDSLRDLADARRRPITLVWDHAAGLREHDPRSYRAIMSILEDVEQERDDFTATIIVR